LYLKDGKQPVLEKIHFKQRSPYYDRKLKDGTEMRSIAQDNGYGVIFITYSNECALQDKGEDCLFCNINATKNTYGEEQGIKWKTPVQIAETVKSTYDDGFHHLTVSGGFIPERREVEYYLDVAENICDALDADSFNGTACVGAPDDLSVFEKYREAGFSTVATNMEVWNEQLFNYICPGKSRRCGGRDNWLSALKEEVNVFGRNRVRSTFVAGLETKESLLDGISFLGSIGVIGVASAWYVNMGSALEGHRTPEDDWHFEVQERTADIYLSNGVSWAELRNATAESDTVAHDLYRWKADIRLDRMGREI
ncbi:MAG: nitrogen fixation protein NifB, partial [Lachnospiraceae bacterium]|nr:nitrogen fixation protein NifB [Lachnospiraceae bacterium]